MTAGVDPEDILRRIDRGSFIYNELSLTMPLKIRTRGQWRRGLPLDIPRDDEQWYIDNHITLHKGKKVINVDRKNREVIAEDGTRQDYDRLILATGSKPFIIPISGVDLPGVISFRDIHDVDAMAVLKKAVGYGSP